LYNTLLRGRHQQLAMRRGQIKRDQAIGKTGKPVNISAAKPEVREKTVPIEAKTANEAN
jgi:hypothetical protein